MCKTTEKRASNSSEEKKDDERVVWEKMTAMAWHNSVASEGSVFNETYKLTRKQVEDAIKHGGYDVVIEIGCGTGDIIGELDVDVQCYGIDINMDFIDFCKDNHPHDHCEFLYGDATDLMPWWNSFQGKYKKPLVLCLNNTLPIMPEGIRGKVVSEMIAIAGEHGRCLVTFWNGRFFSHALMNYYKKNQDLCGPFDMSHVNWDERNLVTPTNYSTTWMLPQEVQKILRSFDVDVELMSEKHLVDKEHINTQGLAIFVWFTHKSTSRAKAYYDSDDAQKFYNSIWGNETTHIGRYDLLTDEHKKSLTLIQQISKAQELHEDQFVALIREKFGDTKIRIVDFGCGFGGLLRRLWESNVVWSGVGCDISGKMCAQARVWNAKLGCDKDISILEESYLDVSAPNESADLIVSMDALLHVGPDRQRRAVQEAARILRPGGWMIFTDIMQAEDVDPVEMQPIYDRIHLSKLGTTSSYEAALTQAGFTGFHFEEHSSNVTSHYGSIREVLLEKANDIGLSADYASKMESGLRTWRDLAPRNIRWGFIMAQKTEKIA